MHLPEFTTWDFVSEVTYFFLEVWIYYATSKPFLYVCNPPVTMIISDNVEGGCHEDPLRAS